MLYLSKWNANWSHATITIEAALNTTTQQTCPINQITRKYSMIGLDFDASLHLYILYVYGFVVFGLYFFCFMRGHQNLWLKRQPAIICTQFLSPSSIKPKRKKKNQPNSQQKHTEEIMMRIRAIYVLFGWFLPNFQLATVYCICLCMCVCIWVQSLLIVCRCVACKISGELQL